ncbi:MAG: hypothetical protein PHX08_07770 [Lachnospiraceae bacterium]|nr:hypothetical protein [Lachnospiraceae bacterium]
MKEIILSYWSWGLLFVLFFALFFILRKRFKERNVWASIVKKHKEITGLKILTEAEFVTRFGAMENKSLLYKMDRLILTSGIKNYMPWINGEVFLFSMAALSMAGFFEGMIIFTNFFVAIFLAAAQAVVLYVIVKGLSGKTYNQIEDSTAIFISILSNHAKGSSDIVTIMQKTAVSLNGPLRGIIEKFIADCECTGNIDIAFDYMKESIDNRQLQIIFMNLKNCMHYQANYEEVLVQMMGQVAAGLSAREDRKNILFSMKMTLIVISITAVIIVGLIGAGLGINVKGSLTENVIGQALLCITGFLYLLVGVKMFGTDK